MNGAPWTDQDVAVLTAHPHARPRELARMLGRSRNAVISKRWQLANPRPRRAHESAGVRLYPVDIHTYVDRETANQIDAFAAARRVSRSEAMRLLLEWALEDHGQD